MGIQDSNEFFSSVPSGSRPGGAAAYPGIDDTGRFRGAHGNRGCVEMWTDQMTGAERSLVTVGRSLTVANGFPPARKAGGGLETPLG